MGGSHPLTPLRRNLTPAGRLVMVDGDERGQCSDTALATPDLRFWTLVKEAGPLDTWAHQDYAWLVP